MADVADQLVTTLEKTVEELRRRAGVPPYDPANAHARRAGRGARPPAPVVNDAQLAAARGRIRAAAALCGLCPRYGVIRCVVYNNYALTISQ